MDVLVCWERAMPWRLWRDWTGRRRPLCDGTLLSSEITSEITSYYILLFNMSKEMVALAVFGFSFLPFCHMSRFPWEIRWVSPHVSLIVGYHVRLFLLSPCLCLPLSPLSVSPLSLFVGYSVGLFVLLICLSPFLLVTAFVFPLVFPFVVGAFSLFSLSVFRSCW